AAGAGAQAEAGAEVEEQAKEEAGEEEEEAAQEEAREEEEEAREEEEEGTSEFAVTDLGDGSYGVEYFITESGAHSVRVTDARGEVDIAGSPFELYVQPSYVSDPGMCRVEGAGADAGVAGAAARFSIVAVDRQGNSCVKGGEAFAVSLELDMDTVDKVPAYYGAAPGAAASSPLRTSFAAEVTDNGDGSYAVSHTLECAGVYAMTVAHANGLVCERRVRIAPSAPHALGCEVVMYNESYVAGERARFLLLLADVYGNRIRHGFAAPAPAEGGAAADADAAGAVRLQLAFDGDAADAAAELHRRQRHRAVDAAVTDNHNGSCSVTCVPVKEGPHSIKLSIGAKGTPAAAAAVAKAIIHVGASKISPENCVLAAAAAQRGGATLGRCSTGGECEYRIVSYDRFKNKLDLKADGSEAFRVYCRRTGSSSIDMSALDNITVAQLDRLEVGVYRA
ncbi:MAG: filamin/ABP280 repeat domain-containing protein, partial [Planctomycetota bacterium]|nr:filamin/ABP280 repeat domain-containing protein [Planctomycetota bacterium]